MFALLAAALLLLPPTGNTRNESFAQAKKTLLELWAGHFQTFYCGCAFNETKQIDLASCGYRPKKNNKRAGRIEFDHVVPAEAFGRSFKAWREGDPACVDSKGHAFKGRKCAEKTDHTFRVMQADLYNLVPAEGELNGLRQNFSPAMIPGDLWEFGTCRVKIQDRKFEPPPDKRGDIARVYFYMAQAYPGRGIISDKNEKLFAAWDAQDPADKWECERAKRIEKVQGNVNLILEKSCHNSTPTP